MKAFDLVNKKFGRLTVISREPNNNRNGTVWLCKCDCGSKPITAWGAHLFNGGIKSCGCLHREAAIRNIKKATDAIKKRPFEALYNLFIHNAQKRKIKIDITYSQFLEFTKIKECHYCENELFWGEHINLTSGDKRSIRSNLDRKNNLLGYSYNNCVACCWPCNKAKSGEFTYEEFLLIGKVIKQIRETRKNPLDKLPKPVLPFEVSQGILRCVQELQRCREEQVKAIDPKVKMGILVGEVDWLCELYNIYEDK